MFKRCVYIQAVAARTAIAKDLQSLHEIVGSRHKEILNVTVSEGFDPEHYSFHDLIKDIRSVRRQLVFKVPLLGIKRNVSVAFAFCRINSLNRHLEQ